MRRLIWASLLLGACGDPSAPGSDADPGRDTAAAPGTGDGADGADGADGTDGTDGTDEPIELGGFSLSGTLTDWPGAVAVGEACVAWADAAPLSREEPLVFRGTTVVGPDGVFQIDGLERASTLGIVLVSDDCADLADGPWSGAATFEGAWAPTAVLLPVETWGHLGAGDILGGVAPRAVSQDLRARLDAELDAGGARFDSSSGLVLGAVVDDEDRPLDNGRVRAPGDTQVLYQMAAGIWEGWTNTTAAGSGWYAIPAAPWGAYVGFSPAGDYDPIIFGGAEGVIWHRRWRPD